MVFCNFCFFQPPASTSCQHDLNSGEELFPWLLSPPAPPYSCPTNPPGAHTDGPGSSPRLHWVLGSSQGSKACTPVSIENKHYPTPQSLHLSPFTSLLPGRPRGSVTTGKPLPQSGPQFPHPWSEVQGGEPPKHKHSSLLTGHVQPLTHSGTPTDRTLYVRATVQETACGSEHKIGMA